MPPDSIFCECPILGREGCPSWCQKRGRWTCINQSRPCRQQGASVANASYGPAAFERTRPPECISEQHMGLSWGACAGWCGPYCGPRCCGSAQWLAAKLDVMIPRRADVRTRKRRVMIWQGEVQEHSTRRWLGFMYWPVMATLLAGFREARHAAATRTESTWIRTAVDPNRRLFSNSPWKRRKTLALSLSRALSS